MPMTAKEWLKENEWNNPPVESQMWSTHYTMMDTIMEEYAKYYLKNKMREIDRNTFLKEYL